MKSWVLSISLALSSLFVFLLPLPAQARNAYSPPGLYNVEYLQLANRFRVILKQRSHAPNMAVRLVVNLGTRHFPCKQRALPHLIENLLVSGASRQGEPALVRRIEEYGGSLGSETTGEYTMYRVDIFDHYAELAIDTLYGVVADTAVTADNLSRAKQIVQRKLGGRPTFVRRIVYHYDVGKTARQKASEWLLPGDGVVCRDLESLDGITGDDIERVMHAAYRPETMSLIIVGNFNREEVLSRIRRTFGGMAQADSAPAPQIETPPVASGGPARVSGTFAPFLGSDGSVGFAFRTEGYDSADAAALAVTAEYLNFQLYEQFRSRQGLSYNPRVSVFFRPDYGMLQFFADVGRNNIGRSLDLARETLRQLREQSLSVDDVIRTRQRILLRWIRGYETNAGLAGFYVESLRDLDRFGRFRNYERDIEQVTAADVARVARRYLASERMAEIIGFPTLLYTQFFAILGVLSMVVISMVVYAVRRSTRRKKNEFFIYRR